MKFNIFVAVSSGVNSAIQFITLLIVFAVILFLTYWTTKFVGNYQRVSGRATNFEIIETYRVTNNKYLQIIKVGKKYLVISICKDRIESLTELSEDEVTIPEFASDDSFSKMFEKVKNSINRMQEGKGHNDDDEDK